MINDDAVIERLHDAVTAYTSHIDGRPDSLDALLLQPSRRSRRPSLVTMATMATGVAAAVAGIVFAATTLLGPSDSSSVQPTSKSGAATMTATRIAAPSSAHYPSSSYFVSRRVTTLTKKEMKTEPVIVRTSDLKVMQTLPMVLMDATLTADGTRVFGFYLGSKGHAITDNSASANPAVNKLVNGDTAGHAVYFDFSTGDVVDFGKATWPGIVAMTVTPDGTTVAYSRIVNAKSGETSIIRVVDIATAKWREFVVPKHRQTLALALSPDAKQLAFTETSTSNILFLADLAQVSPAVSATAVVPPESCRKGAYDYPAWTDGGLYAAQECEPNSRGIVSDVVRLDPQTLQPVGPAVVPLPDGGVTHLDLIPAPGGPRFGFVPVRSATPYDNGDMRISYRNNQEWLVTPGDRAGHRIDYLWSP